MKKCFALLLALLLALGMGAMAESTEGPALVDCTHRDGSAGLGRDGDSPALEYSEEIWCGAIENSNEHPGN